MDKTIRFTISISNRRKNNLGNPWGFMIKSGQMPRSENGKSSCWTMVPQTPFCPCLLLNLSPTYMNEIIFQRIFKVNHIHTTWQQFNYLRSTSMANQWFDTQIIMSIRKESYFIHHTRLPIWSIVFLEGRPIVTAYGNECNYIKPIEA